MYNLKIEEILDEVASSYFDLKKRKMFGGLGYMYRGHMTVGVYKDYLILRVGDGGLERLMENHTFIEPANMEGKIMRGWGMVHHSHLTLDLALKLTQECVDFVIQLPDKPAYSQ